MDGKGGNDWPGWHGRSRKQKSVWNILKDRKRIVKFFQTRRSTLIAVFLLAAIMVLLFGIVSQFQSPSTEDIPGGQTAINYSTFVTQINANNVLAVIIRDNEVSALLLHS